jgi:hypothetical protein
MRNKKFREGTQFGNEPRQSRRLNQMIKITEKRDFLFVKIRFTEGISPRFHRLKFQLNHTIRQSETGLLFFSAQQELRSSHSSPPKL